jgi:condensin complex subunit 1
VLTRFYRKKRVKTEDGMDVDTESEGEEASSSEGEDEDEEMNDASSTPQTPKTPKTKKKSKKLKPRKSELNMEALTNEQAALAALESNQILHLRLRKRYYAEGLNFIRQVEGAMWVSFNFLKKIGEWIIC